MTKTRNVVALVVGLLACSTSFAWAQKNIYEDCYTSGKADKQGLSIKACDNCRSKWKSGFLHIDLGASIPVGGYEMTNYSKPGIRSTIGGGYYFKKYFGLGLSFTHLYNPMDPRAYLRLNETDPESYYYRYKDWTFEAKGFHILGATLDFHIRIPFCHWQIDVIPQIGLGAVLYPKIYTTSFYNDEEFHADWEMTRYPGGLIRPITALSIVPEYRISQWSSITLSVSYLYGLFYLDYWTDDYLETTNGYPGIDSGGEWSTPGVSHLNVQLGYKLNICPR